MSKYFYLVQVTTIERLTIKINVEIFCICESLINVVRFSFCILARAMVNTFPPIVTILYRSLPLETVNLTIFSRYIIFNCRNKAESNKSMLHYRFLSNIHILSNIRNNKQIIKKYNYLNM